MKLIAETERLIIREITLDDAEFMLQLHSNPLVQQYTGEPVVESISEMKERIEEHNIKDYINIGYGRWAVIMKSSNAFTGWCGLKYLDEFDKIDLGYRFLPEFWGKGIATEAGRAVIKYGFEQLGLEQIIAIAFPKNHASIRVMQKVGMTFDKIAPYDEETPEAVWYKINS
ncbi:MAG: GNAT family N-acetyltransferase [Bacteroidia bacterium]|nr:GNAT family N-acetyltransferase [Bacteroidia bacterium]NND52619.1 GNAT family N-acetyltransferase [Flavobacteriaceae bacterium]